MKHDLYLVRSRSLDGGQSWKQSAPKSLKTKISGEKEITYWITHHELAGWDVAYVGDYPVAVKGDERRSIGVHRYDGHDRIYTKDGIWWRITPSGELIYDKLPTRLLEVDDAVEGHLSPEEPEGELSPDPSGVGQEPPQDVGLPSGPRPSSGH